MEISTRRTFVSKMLKGALLWSAACSSILLCGCGIDADEGINGNWYGYSLRGTILLKIADGKWSFQVEGEEDTSSLFSSDGYVDEQSDGSYEFVRSDERPMGLAVIREKKYLVFKEGSLWTPLGYVDCNKFYRNKDEL